MSFYPAVRFICPRQPYSKKYLSPSCARHRENTVGSSMKVSAGPVKLNAGAPLGSNPVNLRGDVAAELATLRTPQSELIRFPTLSTSRLSWKVCRVMLPNEKSCRIRKSTLLYQGLTAPARSAISPRCDRRYSSCSMKASSASHCCCGVTFDPHPVGQSANTISLWSLGM